MLKQFIMWPSLYFLQIWKFLVVNNICSIYLFASDDEEEEKEITLGVYGMTCMSCVNNIESTIREKKGVIDIKVLFMNLCLRISSEKWSKKIKFIIILKVIVRTSLWFEF